MGKKTVGMRIVVFVVTIVMMFTTLCAIWIDAVRQKDARLDLVSTGYADSNARRAALIDFAKKKNFGDIGADTIAELTDEDIQMIGVFLSNFYIPWSTSVGVTREDNQEEMTKKMVDALVNQCNFDKDVATALVPMIFAMSETSSKPLKIAEAKAGETSSDWTLTDAKIYAGKYDSSKKSGEGDWIEVPDGDTATILSFLACAAGDFAPNLGDENGFKNGAEEFASDKKFALYWEDGSTKKVVWANDCGDTGKYNAYFSASAIAYALICDNLNYKTGYGGNTLLFADDYEHYSKLSATQQELVQCMHAPLYVDCFGNIIADMGTDHVVILPGCINPFTWTDADGKNAGLKVNLVNLYTLGEIAESHIKKLDSGLNYLFYSGEQSLFNIERWRLYRGTDDTSVDKNWFDKAEDKTYKALIPEKYQGDTGDYGKGGFCYLNFCHRHNGWGVGTGDDSYWFPNWGNYKSNVYGSVSTAIDFSVVSDKLKHGDISDVKINGSAAQWSHTEEFASGALIGEDAINKDIAADGKTADKIQIMFEQHDRTGWVLLSVGGKIPYATNTYKGVSLEYFALTNYITESGGNATYYYYWGDALHELKYTNGDDTANVAATNKLCDEFETFVDSLGESDVAGVPANYVLINDTDSCIAKSLYKGAYSDMLMIDNFNLHSFEESSSDFVVETSDTTDDSEASDAELEAYYKATITANTFKKKSVEEYFKGWWWFYNREKYDEVSGNPGGATGVTEELNGQWQGLSKMIKEWGKKTDTEIAADIVTKLKFRTPQAEEVKAIKQWIEGNGGSASASTSVSMLATSVVPKLTSAPVSNTAFVTAFADDSSSSADSSSSTDSSSSDSSSKSKSKNKADDIIKVLNLWSEDGTSLVNAVGNKVSHFNSVSETNAVTTLSGSQAKPYLVSIYLSYVYAFYDDEGHKLNWKFNKEGIPTSEGCVDWSDVEFDNSDAMLTETMSLVYYIMHPSKGVAIVKAWFKNKIGGILVDWHEDMAGNASATSTSGTTRYIGFSGYVTVPGLKDLSWTNWLLVKYDSLIIYFIIIMIVIMIGYAMIGSLTFQRAVLGVLLFAFCAYLPPRAINATVDFSNRMCDQIYGSKFTYWALVQHQQYFTQLNAAANAETEDQYLQKLFVAQAQDNTAEYANVTVKWMCPKKDNYMARIQEQIEEETNSNGNITRLIGALLTEQVGGENYIDQANALYLYRSYTDIAEYSKYGYEGTKAVKEYDITKSLGYSTGVKRCGVNWSTFIKDYSYGMSNGASAAKYKDMSDLRTTMDYGFNYPTAKELKSYSDKAAEETGWRYKFVSYSVGSYEAIKNGLKYAKMGSVISQSNIGTGSGGTTAGIMQDKMNFGLSSLNGLVSLGSGAAIAEEVDGAMTKKQVGDFITACYNESPYYYFSYNLYDQLAAKASQAGGNISSYKDLFLAGGEDSYFYNMSKKLQGTPGYGELRDYMDMRSLFTVVIPYLKAANDVVVKWDETEGLYLYDDVQVKFESDGTITIPSEVIEAGADSELAYKFWHNVNVVQLFNMYTPWVDTMYDCNYAKGQNITVAGKKFYVEDPLDPVSYLGSGRPMIFSESEMLYWGLTKADLTTVELKILEVNENCYENMLMLMDYYTFDNDVINTAGAMLQTFEFNKVFSQTDIFSTDYVLYPQAYELKNFSYDAYLRLILSASTGEDINADYSQTGGAGGTQGDFYSNMVQKSSILTGIMLVFVDLFACYAIPALKLFFIVALFFLSIIMILAASIKLEMRLSKVLLESLVLPLLKFLAVSVGMAFFVSMFMYNGNTAVTGRNSTTITLGDPVMVLLVMLLINAGVLVLYFRICKKVFQDAVKYTKTVATSITGMVGGLGSGIVNGVKSGMNRTGLATAAAGAGLAYGLGRGIGKVRDRVRGGSNGTGSAGGDPKARGAANTDVQPKSKPSTSKSDNFTGLNKYDKKLAKGETKVETNKMHANIAEERAKGHRDLVDKDARGVKKLGSKYHEMRAGRYDKKAGKFANKAKTASDKLESNRDNLESRSALAKKRTAARQKTKFGGSAYKKATKSQIKSNAKQKRAKK